MHVEKIQDSVNLNLCSKSVLLSPNINNEISTNKLTFIIEQIHDKQFN